MVIRANMRSHQFEICLVLIVILCSILCSTSGLPVMADNKLTELTKILNGLENLHKEFQNEENSQDGDFYNQMVNTDTKGKQYGLLIELKEPVKTKTFPEIGSGIEHDVISDVNKRQGKWNEDYGLGGGRWGKRGYPDYSFGAGRFGRDVDHVDPTKYDEEND